MGFFSSIFGKKKPPFDQLIEEDTEHNDKRHRQLKTHLDIMRSMPYSGALKSLFKSEYDSALYNIEKIHASGMPGSVFSLELSDKTVKKYFKDHNYQHRSGESHHYWWNTLYEFTMKFRNNIVRAGILDHVAMEDKRGRQEPAERYALLMVHEKLQKQADELYDSNKLLLKHIEMLLRLSDDFKTQLYNNHSEGSELFKVTEKYMEYLRDQQMEFNSSKELIESLLDHKHPANNISFYDGLVGKLRKREKDIIKLYELERKILDKLKDEYKSSGMLLKAA